MWWFPRLSQHWCTEQLIPTAPQEFHWRGDLRFHPIRPYSPSSPATIFTPCVCFSRGRSWNWPMNGSALSYAAWLCILSWCYTFDFFLVFVNYKFIEIEDAVLGLDPRISGPGRVKTPLSPKKLQGTRGACRCLVTTRDTFVVGLVMWLFLSILFICSSHSTLRLSVYRLAMHHDRLSICGSLSYLRSF